MSFRRNRDERDEFLKQHGEELFDCGIPQFVLAKKMRYLSFLDHGYDERGWVENHDAFYDPRSLTDKQIAQLAELVASLLVESYRIPISSRWTRWK